MTQSKQVRRPAKPFASVEQARQLRNKLMDFRPPKDNALAKFIARFVVPYRLHTRFGVIKVSVSGLSVLQQLKGQRCILPFNHPSRKDPEVAFFVGLLLGEYFNYIAAREVFDEHNGWMGRIMQWLGVYSVVRGTADRESFKTTQRLLVENKQKLVIYPEGEINTRNDDPLDSQPGMILFAMWALEQLEKSDKLAPIYVPRIATKFRYVGDIQGSLEDSMVELEKHLNLSAGNHNLYGRLRNVSLKTLQLLQKHYSVTPAPGAGVNEQVADLRNQILAQVARILDVELPDVPLLDKLRVVRNAIDDRIFKSEDNMCGYELKLDRRQAEAMSCVYEMMRTVQLFNAIRDDYVSETMTQERFAEVVDMLELEHFGAATVKGKSIAFVHIGEPINLLDWYPAYKNKKTKKETLTKLAQEVTQGIRDSLQEAHDASKYIPHRKISN